MDKSPIVESLRNLCSSEPIEISCLINKDGDVQASVGHIEPLQLETFGIMAATIFGAASTANEQLKKNKPNKIIVDSADGDTIIRGVGKNYLLVVRVRQKQDLDHIYSALNETAKEIVNHMR
ncbi:MAG: roadblock/LC7 domain-containing protein [Candidatus Aenigmatarchaeota archaeon]